MHARRDPADVNAETLPARDGTLLSPVHPQAMAADSLSGLAPPAAPPATVQTATGPAPTGVAAAAAPDGNISAIVQPNDAGLGAPQSPATASAPTPTQPTPPALAPDAPQTVRNGDAPQGMAPSAAAAAMVTAAPGAARNPIAAPGPRTLISAQPGRIGRETGVPIAHRIGAGGDEMTLHLSPASLGRIEVKIAFEDGSLRATLRADNPAALDLLRRDSTDLSRALDQAGVRSDSGSLTFQGRGADGQPAGSRQQSPFAAFAQRGQPTDSPTTPIPDSYQPLRTSGRVDFLA